MMASRPALPNALYRFLLAVLLLTVASLAFSFVARTLGYGLPAAAAYYYVPRDFFMDFLGLGGRALQFGTAAFYSKPRGEYVMYPAPLIFLLVKALRIPHPARVFGPFLLAVGLAMASYFYRMVCRAGLSRAAALLLASTVLLTSYPYLYLLQRGNAEVFVWITLTLGLWAFARQKPAAAAVLFGLAAALKLYPIIFLGLFLQRSQFRYLILSLSSFVGANVAALWWLGPTIAQAYKWDSLQLAAFGRYYAALNWALGYDHSIFALVKTATLPWHADLSAWVRPYTISMAVGCFLLFILVIRKLPLANQLGCLSILCVTVAPVSYDYTLLNLYPFFTIVVLFAIQGWRQKRHIAGMELLLGFFAVVLTPNSFVIVNGARFGAQLRCLCLLAMFGVLIRVRLPELSFPFKPVTPSQQNG